MKKVAGSVELDLRFLQMDLQNLQSVKAAANSFRQRETRLDLLINNAGV
jgi:NAD(P)-dependent dehydrogenase (short-subunit alcohol dehydrogenase family)